MSLTPLQVAQVAQLAGFTGQSIVMAVAIAGAESNWNPSAVGDVTLENATWGPSIGMWQVRTLKAQTGTGQIRDINWLTDNPQHQAQAAYAISSLGSNWKPWSTYTNSAYQAYMSRAVAAYNQLATQSEVVMSKILFFQATASGKGYWIVFDDGAVFAFGDAEYHGRVVKDASGVWKPA